MAFGYIGDTAPDQRAYANKGVFKLGEVTELINNNKYSDDEFILMDYWISAGGAGGGGGGMVHGGSYLQGGNGGAGGLITATNNKTDFKLGTSYAVSIGAGGAGGAGGPAGYSFGAASGTAGTDTTCVYEGGTYTAVGGGSGGGRGNYYNGYAGGAGGSGGGGGATHSSTKTGGAGTVGQGNNGGTSIAANTNSLSGEGGGGGGFTLSRNALNTDDTFGGVFYAYAFGSNVISKNSGPFPDYGGLLNTNHLKHWSGGTATNYGGMWKGNNPGVDGIANTGAGGGGGMAQNNAGGSGASGYIIFKYPAELTISTGTLTVDTQTVGDYKITRIDSGADDVSWSL